MTIGTALVNVLAECNLDVTAPQITATDFQMRQIRTLMDEAGRDIGWRAEWAKAAKEFTVTSASEASLPSDFRSMAQTGAVVLNDFDATPLRPIVAPEMWALASKQSSDQVFYHLRDGKILFSATLNAQGALVQYVSRNWLVGKEAITSNDDVTVFPEHLLVRSTVVRFRRVKGLPFDDLLQEFEADLDAAIKADRGA